MTVGLICSNHAQDKAASVNTSKPNFVFFIADDVSQMDFGCYGHPTIKTPHIDGLAAKGML